MKKLQLGPRNHRVLARTTVRFVGSVAEYRFRTDRLVIRTKPADAKLVVIDAHAAKDPLVQDFTAPIAIQRFGHHASARRDPPAIRTIDTKRGTEVWVVVSSLDERDTYVSMWFEQFESVDLS